MKLKEAVENKELKITIVILLIVGIIIGVGISYSSAVEIEKTESGRFCAKCHTMEPMTQTHYASAHGGHNKYGVAAQCIDCHLPHDTLSNYRAPLKIGDTHNGQCICKVVQEIFKS